MILAFEQESALEELSQDMRVEGATPENEFRILTFPCQGQKFIIALAGRQNTSFRLPLFCL
jgi:hypothetical protein